VAAVRDLVAGAVAAVVEVPPPGLASTASSRRCGDVAEANASTLIRRASPLYFLLVLRLQADLYHRDLEHEVRDSKS